MHPFEPLNLVPSGVIRAEQLKELAGSPEATKRLFDLRWDCLPEYLLGAEHDVLLMPGRSDPLTRVRKTRLWTKNVAARA